jgi:hypothetical protein
MGPLYPPMTSLAAPRSIALWKLLAFGFIAGALSTLIFHQSFWYVLNVVGLIPWERPAWPLDPIPPLGVPAMISKAFWGGLWGAGLAPLLLRLRGSSYWLGWVLVGAVALPLVAFFVVPPLKGQPIPVLWPRMLASVLVNSVWGFGTGLFLKWFGASRS